MVGSHGIGLSFMVLMIIGMVKGRWLELDTFSTSMISDGVHDMANNNPPNLCMGVSNSSVSTITLYAEKRCHSIYGFLPCADTMQEGVFLMFMYTYLMMLGEDWINKGSHALFKWIGDKAVGLSIFQVLISLPRIVIVIVSGILSTASDAQNQVAFGVGMYAGSTVISLTLICGLSIILSEDLRQKKPTQNYKHQEDSSTTSLPRKRKLSVLTDTGVNIDKETGNIAAILLLSLIPFATVELVVLIKSRIMILVALVVSSASLLSYFAYQILQPWIRHRTLAYVRQKKLRNWFFFHVQWHAEENVLDQQGVPKSEVFESIFKKVDIDKDEFISLDELERWIQNEFDLKDSEIGMDYAKAEILTQFDSDQSGKISKSEFQQGCIKWLEKWKYEANNSDSVSKILWIKRANPIDIEKIMARILKQVLDKDELLTKDGKPDREKIERLFSNFDKDCDGELSRRELTQFLETIRFGVLLCHDTVLKEILKDFDNDDNGSIRKQEFVDGFIKWIEKAINHDQSIKDTKNAIAKFEKDCWEEIDSLMKMEAPKAKMLYAIFGMGVIYLISGAFIQSVIQFSNAAGIPFLLTSFAMAPIAMNFRMVIRPLLKTRRRVSENASLKISEIFSRLVMNNLLGLSTLLATVYIKGLSWSYSAEVLTIMIPCAIVGLFAFKRDTYNLWAAIAAILLYPISVFLYYVMDS